MEKKKISKTFFVANDGDKHILLILCTNNTKEKKMFYSFDFNYEGQTH